METCFDDLNLYASIACLKIKVGTRQYQGNLHYKQVTTLLCRVNSSTPYRSHQLALPSRLVRVSNVAHSKVSTNSFLKHAELLFLNLESTHIVNCAVSLYAWRCTCLDARSGLTIIIGMQP